MIYINDERARPVAYWSDCLTGVLAVVAASGLATLALANALFDTALWLFQRIPAPVAVMPVLNADRMEVGLYLCRAMGPAQRWFFGVGNVRWQNVCVRWRRGPFVYVVWIRPS